MTKLFYKVYFGNGAKIKKLQFKQDTSRKLDDNFLRSASLKFQKNGEKVLLRLYKIKAEKCRKSQKFCTDSGTFDLISEVTLKL